MSPLIGQNAKPLPSSATACYHVRMDTLRAELLTKAALREHGLDGWKFAWATAKNRLGQCQYRNKTITLSIDYVRLNDEQLVMETAFHEIAHALVGPGNGHGPVWKAMAIKLGVRPRSHKPVPNKVPGKYLLVCLHCGKESPRHRKTSQPKACGDCCRKHNYGKYSPIYQMVWRENRVST